MSLFSYASMFRAQPSPNLKSSSTDSKQQQQRSYQGITCLSPDPPVAPRNALMSFAAKHGQTASLSVNKRVRVQQTEGIGWAHYHVPDRSFRCFPAVGKTTATVATALIGSLLSDLRRSMTHSIKSNIQT